MKIGDLFVKLGLDVSAFQQGMGVAAQSITGMKVSMNALRASAAVALGSTTFAVFGAIANKAADDEAALARLRQAVENTGASYDRYSGQISKALSAGRAFGFSGNQQREALALLVTQTGSVEEGLRRLAIAYDVARATQTDLYAVSRLLGKVTEENVVGLNRIGIAVRAGANESEFFADVMQKVGGQAESQSKTLGVRAAVMSQVFSDAMSKIGAVVGSVAPSLAALSIAFEQTGLRGIIATTGISGVGLALKGVGMSALLASKALLGFVVALAPFAALAVAGVALAAALAKVGEALNIPILRDVVDTFRMLAKIVQTIGFEGLIKELFGIGRSAPVAASAVDTARDAIQRFSKVYSDMTDRLKSAGAFPGGGAFKQIEDTMRAFARDVPNLTQSLALIEDTLAGTRGKDKVDATRSLGASIRASLVKTVSAEVEGMEQLRDNAKRELESVARFWSDEALRRADFARTMADRARPVIETIDQLTRDMGEGFDNAKRAAQAQAIAARFDAETVELRRKEAERIGQLRPPETPTADRIVKEFGSLDALDARIAELHTRNAEVFAALDALITGVVKTQEDALAEIERATLALQQRGGLAGSAAGAAIEEGRTPPEGIGKLKPGTTGEALAGISAALAKREAAEIAAQNAPKQLEVAVNISAPDDFFKELRTERIEQIARDTFGKIAKAAAVLVRQVGGSEVTAAMIQP